MAINSVRILPDKINPEWLEEVYQNMSETGQLEIDEFLSAQDLEVSETGKIVFRPLRYKRMPVSCKASILFANGKSEYWDAKVSSEGEVVLTDYEGNTYETLLELRPGEDCPEERHIIEVELVFSSTIVGF